MGQDDIKFRMITRANEKPKDSAKEPSAEPRRKVGTSLYGLAVVLLFAALALWAYDRGSKPATSAATGSPNRQVSNLKKSEEVQTRLAASVQRHLDEARMRQQLLARQQEFENMKIETMDDNGLVLDESALATGPLMDQDKVMDQIYDDLDLNSRGYSDHIPHDWINSRLANRKWLNEHERAERVNFVRNFILSAYERGYEVQLNENLVVIGVRRLRKDRVVSIDQIMDRLSKQGF